MKNQVNEVLEKIREVCPELLRKKTIVETFDGRKVDTSDWSHPQLNHLLWAVQNGYTYTCMRISSFGHIYEGNGIEWRDIGCIYNLQKSVEDNLRSNPELTKWVHGVIIGNE